MSSRCAVAGLCVAAVCLLGYAAPVSSQIEWGAEVQAYPAGVIAVGQVSAGHRTGAFSVHGGYNWTNRRDWGEHDDERGGGPGVGIAWHRRVPDVGGWYVGARTDLWFMDIDWMDESPLQDGSTSITVLQPTVRGGYGWSFSSGVSLYSVLALGMEVNVASNGEDVGEGPILLLGLGVLY